MGRVGLWNASSVYATWGATPLLEGAAPNSFVRVFRNVPVWRQVKGADGEGARIRTNDFSGRVEFEVIATSTTNNLLTTQLQDDQITGVVRSPFGLFDFDGTTLWASPNAYLEGWPDEAIGSEVGRRRWAIICDPLIAGPGGSVQV